MFRQFAAKKDSQLDALKEIHLSCPSGADNTYKDQCARLLAKTEKVDVILHLTRWQSPVPYDMGWGTVDVFFSFGNRVFQFYQI